MMFAEENTITIIYLWMGLMSIYILNARTCLDLSMTSNTNWFATSKIPLIFTMKLTGRL